MNGVDGDGQDEAPMRSVVFFLILKKINIISSVYLETRDMTLLLKKRQTLRPPGRLERCPVCTVKATTFWAEGG